jgi:hypothetical protein
LERLTKPYRCCAGSVRRASFLFWFPPQEEFPMKILFSLAVAAILLGRVYCKAIVDELFVTLLFIAASPWLIPFFVKTFHLKAAELFGLKIEIENLEGKLQEESRRLDQLFLLSMGKHAFNHMEKLALPQGFGSFSVSPPFERELVYLENLGGNPPAKRACLEVEFST